MRWSEFGPAGAPDDVWSDRTKGFATKADLAQIASTVERIIGKFGAYFGS